MFNVTNLADGFIASLQTTFINEFIKFIFVALTLLLTWFIGNRISIRWAIIQRKKEIEIDTLNEFYKLYGEFFSMWKLWRLTLNSSKEDGKEAQYEEVKHRIERESFIAEGRVEAILVKIASEKRLNDTQLEILGRFRQAYQRLRECMRENKDLPWFNSDYFEYSTFKRLSYLVSRVIQSNYSPLMKWIMSWIPSLNRSKILTLNNKKAVKIITSNYWQRNWIIRNQNDWEILSNFESPGQNPLSKVI